MGDASIAGVVLAKLSWTIWSKITFILKASVVGGFKMMDTLHSIMSNKAVCLWLATADGLGRILLGVYLLIKTARLKT